MRQGLGCAVATLSLASAATAQYVSFARPTDTIRINGGTVLAGGVCTIEARVAVLGADGMIFNEFAFAEEDKRLGTELGRRLVGNAYPIGYPQRLVATSSLPLLVWRHVAFVQTSTQQMLWVDGVLVGSRPLSGPIANSSNSVATIGAILRGGGVVPAFLGHVDTLRVSSVARYATPFVPPVGDLPADGATEMVFDFNEPPGASFVQDRGPNRWIGTLGSGFAGATAPTLGNAPPVSGQANSSVARLEIQGAGTGTAPGPFVVQLPSGATLTLAWRGPANMPFVLAAGVLNPHHTILPCVGSIDIGSPPFLSDLAIVFNGTDPMQRFLFTTNALGTAQQTLTLPTLPPGLLGGLQGLVLQPSQTPCPFVFTAAFALDIQ